MLRIVLSGCSGRMGTAITECVRTDDECTIVAGIDLYPSQKEYPIFKSADDVEGTADIIIDFSNPSNLSGLLKYALKTKTPVVIATTGYNAEQIEEIKKASESIPIFFSANMSLGISLLVELSKKATEILGDRFNIEIIEKHHNQKIDAPSGTALMLADAISSVLPYSSNYVYDRHSQRKKRDPNEIGIHSIRGGNIVGEHEILFAGDDEVISLKHIANSKRVLANGAISAAKFLFGKPNGLYNMGDMVK